MRPALSCPQCGCHLTLTVAAPSERSAPIDRNAEWRALAAEGLTAVEAASRLQLGRSAAYGAARRLGIKFARAKRGPRRTFSRAEWAAVVNAVNAEADRRWIPAQVTIAAEYGVTRERARQWLDSFRQCGPAGFDKLRQWVERSRAIGVETDTPTDEVVAALRDEVQRRRVPQIVVASELGVGQATLSQWLARVYLPERNGKAVVARIEQWVERSRLEPTPPDPADLIAKVEAECGQFGSKTSAAREMGVTPQILNNYLHGHGSFGPVAQQRVAEWLSARGAL